MKNEHRLKQDAEAGIRADEAAGAGPGKAGQRGYRAAETDGGSFYEQRIHENPEILLGDLCFLPDRHYVLYHFYIKNGTPKATQRNVSLIFAGFLRALSNKKT